MKFKEYDVVRLMTNKYKENGFLKGMIGTVMMDDKHPRYLVDFADSKNNGDSDLLAIHEKYLAFVPEDQWQKAYTSAFRDVENHKDDAD